MSRRCCRSRTRSPWLSPRVLWQAHKALGAHRRKPLPKAIDDAVELAVQHQVGTYRADPRSERTDPSQKYRIRMLAASTAE